MTKECQRCCSVDGCTKPHKARGFCSEHYQRFKTGRDVTVAIKRRDRNPPAHCTAPECVQPVKSRGLCKMHYARLLRHGTIEQVSHEKPCSVEGCEAVAVAKGLCQKHYYRQLRSGTTADSKVRLDDFRKCSVGSCLNIAVAQGFCGTHYKRHQRQGHVLETRAADWGAREKHPLYAMWKNLMRVSRAQTCERWHDLWNFVADVGDSRPSVGHLLTRRDDTVLFGPDNFYWRAPQISSRSDDEKAERAAYMRNWTAANADKLVESGLRKHYGIGFADYQRMFEQQKGVCAICFRPEIRVDHRTKKVSRLAVDHDHKTGAVRQLLCHTCNSGLGAFGDDPVRLRAALAYLERHAAPDPDFPVPMPALTGAHPWPPGFVN